MKNNNIKLSGYIIYLLGILILLISFYYDIDGSNTPLSGDFRDTWPYVIKLKESLMIDPSQWTLHFPLHYFLLSRLNFLFTNPTDIRLIFCVLSFITPYLFYLCLKTKYQNENFNTLLILSTIIFFTPSYIYSAVWANDNNLSYIFILLGIYFYLKYTNKFEQNINLYISFLFFALSCYSRQYYAVFYAFLLFFFFNKIDFRNYFFLLIFSAFLAMPGLYFLYKFPAVYTELVFSGNIFNTILSNVVSIFVYTLPIILINVICGNIKMIKIKNIFICFMISLLVFFLIIVNYDLKSIGQNGGIFFIASKLIFNNYLLFYLIFIINFTFILIIFTNKFDLFFLFSILIVISGIITLQKYFEPLFFIFLFFFTKSKFKHIFLSNQNASIYLVIYHFLYYVICLSDVIYKIRFI
jgi:hypothetical protein|tara:strand:- start:66 stop:1298 length:1233 start_codon:yes stop_codon:yes gene_type:complete